MLRPTPLVERGLAGSVRVGLLRGFQLSCDGETIPLPPSAQRLVAFLALQERAVQRLYVASTLWIDANEDGANASLRTALWRLHRIGHHLVDATGTHLVLAAGVEVDVRELATASRVALRRPAACGHDELDALIGAGELLPDWYDDWALIERERLRQVRLHALEALCDRFAGAGAYGEAIEAGLAAVDCEPLRESAHRAVVRAHLAEGNPGEATRQFVLYRRLLADSLGLEPSEQMRRLVEALPIGDAGVTAAP